jgi:hypothetical protein
MENHDNYMSGIFWISNKYRYLGQNILYLSLSTIVIGYSFHMIIYYHMLVFIQMATSIFQRIKKQFNISKNKKTTLEYYLLIISVFFSHDNL